MAGPEAIFKYSKFIEDDGAIDKVTKDFDKLESHILNIAKNLKGKLNVIDKNDTEELQKISTEIRKVAKANDDLNKSKKATETTRKKSVDLTRKEVKAIEEERLARSENRKQLKQQIRLEKAQVGSIEELRAKLAIVTRQWANLSDRQGENINVSKRLSRVKSELTEQLKKEEKATGDTRRNVGNYAEAVKEAIKELKREEAQLSKTNRELKQQQSVISKNTAEWKQYENEIDRVEKRQKEVNSELGKTPKTKLNLGGGGGLGGIPSGGGGGALGGIGGAVSGVVSKLGPVGVGVAALVGGVTLLGDTILDVEKKFTSLTNQVQKITGLQGAAVDEIVVNTVALSDVYGAETDELIRSQNVLIKTFGINASEASEIIEAGFQSGANSQGDLLDGIAEYSAQIKAAGGDATLLIDILDKSGKEGIYSDKGIDTVKEFGLAIREQTAAQVDALEAGFGKEKAQNLLQGVRDGSIDTIEALRFVSNELKNVEDVALKQTIIADLFKGAGEDAGIEFIESLGDIGRGLDDIVDKNNPLIQAEQTKLALAKELAEAQKGVAEEALGSGATLENLITNIKIFLFDSLGNIIKFFIGVKDVLTGGFGEVSDSILFIRAPIDLIIASVTTLFKVITGDFSGAWDTAKEGVISYFHAYTFGLFRSEKASTKLSKAEKLRNRITNEATKLSKSVIKSSKDELKLLNNRIEALQDDNLTKEEQIKVTDSVIATAKKYGVQIDIENGQIVDLTKVRNDLNQAILDEASARAEATFIATQQEKLLNAQLELSTRSLDDNRSTFEKLANVDLGKIKLEGISESAIKNLENAQAIFEKFRDQLKDLGVADKFTGQEADVFDKTLDDIGARASELQTQLTKLNSDLQEAIANDDIDLQASIRTEIGITSTKLKAELKARGITHEQYINLLEVGEKNGADASESAGSRKVAAAKKTADERIRIEKETLKMLAELKDERNTDGLQDAIDANEREQTVLNQQIDKAGDSVSEALLKKRIELTKEEFSLRRKLNEENRAIELRKIDEEIAEKLKKVKKGSNEEALLLQLLEEKKDKIEDDFDNLAEKIKFDLKQKKKGFDDELDDLKEKLKSESKLLSDAKRENSLINVEDNIDTNLNELEDSDTIGQARKEIEDLKAIYLERKRLQDEAIISDFDFQIEQAKLAGASTDEIKKLEQQKANALLGVKIQYQKDVDDLGVKLIDKENAIAEAQKEQLTKIIDEIGAVFEKVLDRLSEKAQELIDQASDRVGEQQDAIDVQRQRAQDGLENSLAFEKDALAKREKELLEEQKRLERIEKIKALYASYTSYASSGDPQSAITNTIRDFAILEGIAATFGDGGIVDEVVGNSWMDKLPSNGIFRGDSHNAKSGGIPIMVEGSEGIFSKKEMSNLGRENFHAIKSMAGKGILDTNFWSGQNRTFAKAVPVSYGMSEVSSGLTRIENAIKRQPEKIDSTEWRQIADFMEKRDVYKRGNKIEKKTTKIRLG